MRVSITYIGKSVSPILYGILSLYYSARNNIQVNKYKIEINQ